MPALKTGRHTGVDMKAFQGCGICLHMLWQMPSAILQLWFQDPTLLLSSLQALLFRLQYQEKKVSF